MRYIIIIMQNFAKLGISLTNETKKDIAAGNFSTLVSFLMRIKSEIAPKVKSYSCLEVIEGKFSRQR